MNTQSIKQEQPQEQAIDKELEKLADYYADNCSYPQSGKEHFKTTYWIQHKIAVDAFKAGAVWQQSQQSRETDGWISVEDRLPDYDQKVLVFGESKAMNPSMGGAYIMIGRRQDLSKSSLAKDAHRYQDENQFSQMSYVTHWQHLPSPPKNSQ